MKVENLKLKVLQVLATWLFLFFISWPCFSSTIKIGVLNIQKPTNITIKPISGKVSIYIKKGEIGFIPADSTLSMTVVNDSVHLILNGRPIGNYKKVKLIPDDLKQGFALQLILPRNYETTYSGSLVVKSVGGILKLVNYVELEDYVASVVEAESGLKQPSEFSKIQALICRTYALAHLKRHEEDGYSLCDQTHCQVYRGKANNAKIIAAVNETQRKIIIDSTFAPITAAFHANCGGQTRNSEDEWNNYLSYLRAVKDTFCIHTLHAHWTAFMPLREWKKYLQQKEPTLTFDSTTSDSSFNRSYRYGEVYYTYKNAVVPYKTIRTDWKLKSTQFSITQQHDSLVFLGYGYGHGVGLCQEGAMQMCAKGFSYLDVINFYYYHVAIIDSDALTVITEPD